MRGSVLGLLIALYDHPSDHGATTESEDAQGDNGHGGARTIASSGLKWLCLFVNALVDGATSIGARVPPRVFRCRQYKSHPPMLDGPLMKEFDFNNTCHGS
jgi:hypothetical protein